MTEGHRRGVTRLLPESPAERAIALATLANTVGNGMFYTVSAIYFTQSVGLSPAQVGLGLTVAGLCGLLAGVPAGHLGDVRGPRNILIALLLAGALVHVVGELLQSAGGWAVSFGLAPEHRQGQYQGFFSTGFAASSMLAPLVLTTLCVTWGVPGWLLVGALPAVAGLALAPLVARAERARVGSTSLPEPGS